VSYELTTKQQRSGGGSYKQEHVLREEEYRERVFGVRQKPQRIEVVDRCDHNQQTHEQERAVQSAKVLARITQSITQRLMFGDGLHITFIT
jgi:hypothetical protein